MIHDTQCILCNQFGSDIFIVALRRDEDQRVIHALRAFRRRDLLGQVVDLDRPSLDLVVEEFLVIFRPVLGSLVVNLRRQLQHQA